MKRLAYIAAPAAVAAAAAIGLGSASAQPAADRTFKLVQTGLDLSVVDLPPQKAAGNDGTSRGDMVIFTKRLSTPAGRRVGTLHLVCTVSRPQATLEASVFHCNGAYALRGGQLTAAVVTPLTEGTVRLAVTGGTGRYAGARGTIVSRPGRGDDTVDTIRLAG